MLGIFLNKNAKKFLDASKFGSPVFKYLLLKSTRGSEGTHDFILYNNFLIKLIDSTLKESLEM